MASPAIIAWKSSSLAQRAIEPRSVRASPYAPASSSSSTKSAAAQAIFRRTTCACISVWERNQNWIRWKSNGPAARQKSCKTSQRTIATRCWKGRESTPPKPCPRPENFFCAVDSEVCCLVRQMPAARAVASNKKGRTRIPGRGRPQPLFQSLTQLEQQLQPKLQDARIVRRLRLQEAVSEAGGIRGGIVRSSITTDRIVGNPSTSRRTCRRIVAGPLGMVENIECFHAELHRNGFVNRETLEQRHVKIQPAGTIQEVSSRIAERQPGRRRKRSRIVEQGSRAGRQCGNRGCRRLAIGTHAGNQIGIRPVSAYTVCHTSVVAEDAIQHAKRLPGIERRDSGVLPISECHLLPSVCPVRRKAVHVAERKYMPFVEIRARSIRREIERIYEILIGQVGSIVNRMAICVRCRDNQGRDRPSDRDLQRVVARIRRIKLRSYRSKTHECPEGRRIVSAGGPQVNARL